MPRKNRATIRDRRVQVRKPDRLTIRWLTALRSTPGFVREDRVP